MANYTKINLNKQSDLVLTNAEINNPSGLLRTELDNILFSATTEVNRAKSAESVLQSNIDNLTSNSTDYTDAEVSKEKARAIAAEGSLETKVDADVSTEKARAIAAEGSLETKVNTDVNAEKVRAVAAEGSLETNINTEKSRIDAILSASDADKDSFAEIVTLINEVDTENDNAFGAYVISNNAALSSEKARAIAAEGSLETEIGNEVSSLEGQISQEVSDRESAVQSEKERAVAAEGSLETALSNESSFLQDEISDEVTNRTADVSTEKARAIAAEGSLETKVDGHVSDLETTIKDEEKRAIAAEGSLETKVNADVSTEKARAIAAEGSLETKIGTDIQKLKQNVDDSVERVLDLNFKNMFAQKIGGTTEDKRNYTLDVNPLEASLQVFENGLMLEEVDDYTVVVEDGKVKTVTFNYEVKSDWKIKFYGVPFNASDVDLIEG